MKQLSFNMNYGKDMDEKCIPLCNAINSLPGLKTIESCEGHDKKPFRIWFKCDGTSMEGLFFLTRCVDWRYFDVGHYWQIKLSVGDYYHDDILPTIFCLESRSCDGEITVGNEAYEQAKALIENMNEHLNHEGFIKGYKINLDKFIYETI